MLYWIPYAFVRITVFFTAGIISGLFLPHLLPTYLAWSALLTLVTLYFVVFFFNRWKRRAIWNPGLAGLLAITVAGFLTVEIRREENDPHHLSKYPSAKFIECIIDRQGQEKERNWKEVAVVSRIRDGAAWRNCSGRILLYFPKDEFKERFLYGDKLLIRVTPQPVPEPYNPGQFNYKAFLANKNIHHQGFPRGKDVAVIGHEPPSYLIARSIALRRWAEKQLKLAVPEKQEQAIALALVLGITEGLDNEMMGAYAATGAMHVLSVSGLHVGILYLVLMFFLKPVQRLRNGRWIVAVASLLVLWVYACVTGLSPSVLRAVTMFSFMVIGRALDRTTNIYNVVAASAFLLLVVDPFLITSAGFQLSYLAVVGIVYLQPLLYNLWEPRYRFVDEVWKVTSVSISAQLATFALGMLYFHQFPNYFLLSNLFVLPLGFAVLVGGLAVLAFSFWNALAAVAGILLQWVIRLLNFLIFFTESLPYSVTGNIHITSFHCVVLMTGVVSIVLFLQHRRLWLLWTSSTCCLAYAAASWAFYVADVAPARLSVYRVPRVSAFDLMQEGRGYHSCEGDSNALSFHVQPNRSMREIRRLQPVQGAAFCKTLTFGKLMVWNGKSILQITSAPEGSFGTHVQVDYFIISGNAFRTYEQLPANIKAGTTIIDSGNSFSVADSLLKEFVRRNIPVHSVWHHGAFDKII